ncbi:AraC family transcriptional regulator [Pseudomonas sp. MAFF212427]|uniref:AraC family transcriptional regulator n=1 Tax=Pseudomonas brassicae TaxID=2708063 RepID=A0A6B3NPY8_9PSED|nr:AraC family transcriptional regulator [Pseudomonas brassicae]NER63713.1 AraC family transcriptional regulator [Pseudomonas brassicae]
MANDNSRDWLQRAAHPGKVERIEAYFSGYAYSLHRHDTYAIGRTLAGVQNFHYRGSTRHSLPGQTMVLHPDEVHDGEAGTEAGFRYRMIYLEPALVQQALGGRALPFICGGQSDDPRLFAATEALLQRMDDPLDAFAEEDAIYDLVQVMAGVAGQRRGRQTFDFVAAERARLFIHDTLALPICLDDLVQASGRERFALSRDFRVLYGTSPYRYITQRRLERARRLMLSGVSLTEAALGAGFYDQSHMTRHFQQALGLTPARWLHMQG